MKALTGQVWSTSTSGAVDPNRKGWRDAGLLETAGVRTVPVNGAALR